MNIAVFGLGSMGRRRIRLIKGLFQDATFYCVDTREDRIKEFEELMQSESGSFCFYMEIDEMPKDIDVNAAFVCTSPSMHSEIIEKCLLRGWNVFSEINLLKDGYDRNIKLAKEKDVLLYLSSTPLFRRDIGYIISKAKASNGLLNYIYHVGQYLPDWHPWENYKDIFIANTITNGCREIMAIEMPWMVEAFGEICDVQVVSNKQTELDISFDDKYNILIRHCNGNTGVFVVDVVCRTPVRNLEVFGEKLYIKWNGSANGVMEYDLSESKDKMVELFESDSIHHEEGYSNLIIENAYEDEIIDFFKVLNGEKTSVYSFEKDIKILDWIDRIERC